MKKRKCMASGGTVRTPQTMAEQLANVVPRKFVDGGTPGVIRDGNSFRDDPAYAAQQRHSANAELERLSTPVVMPNVAAVPTALPVSAPLSGATQALPPVQSIAAPPTALGNVFANPSAGNVLAPAGGAQTFAERSLAAGINPNATYRAGGPGDPHASGGLAATAAQRIAGSNATATALAANQQAPQVDNPMDTTSTRQRRQTRTPGLQDGGRVGYRRGNEFSDRPMTGTIGTQSRDPVATTPKPKQQIAEPVYPQERNQMPQQPGRNAGSGMTSAADLGAILAERRKQISRESGMADGGRIKPNLLTVGEIASGLREAIVDPLAADWRQGNQAIKLLRDQHQTIDNITGIHPAIAAAQVANDVMANDVDGGTALNVAQAVPIVKRLTGLAGLVAKSPKIPVVGRMAIDMPATMKKNAAITSGQILGQPANAMADGGMVRHRFEGKGGPRSDDIPVTVAGEQIKVSDGEEAVILPAKTAQNPQAIAQIGMAIQQSNDGRAPDMGGLKTGGKYAGGAAPHIVDINGQVYINGRPAGLLPAPPGPDFTVDSAGNARGVNQPGSSVGQYRGPGTAVTNYVPSAQPRPYDIAKPAPRGMAFDAGKAVGTAYKNVGGALGAAGKIANIAVPVIAAAQTFGDNGIRVQGNREADPNYDETAGMPRVASTLKEAALRAGDWGTKGLDIVGGWALPKGEASFNDAYRQGVGQLEGVSAPTSQQIAAVAEQQRSKENYGNDGVRRSITDVNNRPSPDLSQGPGDARFNQATGVLSFTQPGFDPTKQRVADGTGMITRAGGQTQVFTDMSPNQYVGADGKPGQTWEKTAQYADAMRLAQADRERLVRTQAENAVADLASPRPDVRATAERQLQAIGQLQGIDAQSLSQAGHRQAVAANNPAVAQQLAQQRVGMGDIDLQNKIELNALYAAHQAAKTPEEQAQIAEVIRVRTGKDKQDEFAHAAGGTTINPETMGVEKTPDVIYSKRTGQSPGAKAATTQQYAVKPGMTVQAPDGVHTFQGKTITVKAGKVVEVK